MSKKRPLAPPASPTDEWGLYDPSKAGMQALYSRLGRPIIRASEASERRARRRGLKVDRPADGVGMAIEEAKRRAGLMSAAHPAPPQTTPEPVAAPPPVVAAIPAVPVVPATPAIDVPAPVKRARATRAKAGKGSKRKPISAAISAAAARVDVGGDAPPVVAPVAVENAAATAPTIDVPTIDVPAIDSPAADSSAGRRARKTPRSRPAAGASASAAPVVPPPSPRRPRGPVPLAAWAHAVSDTPRPEPKRTEGKGLWRGIFRIPSEVALVEYGRGCRIHRLVIESAPDSHADPF